MKPYQTVPIAESGEPLIAIPSPPLAHIEPHPYAQLGAPYGDQSPFFLRRGVCDRLLAAQTQLTQLKPGWTIQVFDALRPVAVQTFMVQYALVEMAEAQGLDPDQLSDAARQRLEQAVSQFWATPSFDPATPPPHSTGGAIDVTLLNAAGEVVDMGSPIDEISPRSFPNYFAEQAQQTIDSDTRQIAANYDQNRKLLAQVMHHAGFAQHPNEWWHFCYGDQFWAWLTQQSQAIYGRADLAI